LKVIIQPFLIKYGGAERKTLLLARECKKNNINFQVITWKYNKQYYKEYGVENKIIQIKSTNFTSWILNVCYYILLKQKVTHIFAMNYPANIIAGLCSFFTAGKINSTWMCNEVSSDVNKEKRGLFKQTLFSFGEYLSIQFIHTIYVNSKTTYNSLKKSYFKKANKIIHSGIDIKKFQDMILKVKKEKNIVKDIDFIYLGRVEKHKGLDTLLELAKINKSEIFYVLGDGNYMDEMRRKSKNMANIIYKQNCDDLEKVEYIMRSKLFLFTPSNEPLGVVVMEAIFLGTSVLAFNRGGPSEIIRNGIDGYLANSHNDFIKLANTYKNIEDGEKEKDHKTYIEKNFNQDKMIKQMIEGWLISNNYQNF
tara:strand:+ start:10367 stop:11461 length:1095 start_codon:yes stop_codon:yes gene_type:complete